MIQLTKPIEEINFPIGTTEAALLLNRHVVTVREHLQQLNCPKIGSGEKSGYIIDKETLLKLTKTIGKSKKKKFFQKILDNTSN